MFMVVTKKALDLARANEKGVSKLFDTGIYCSLHRGTTNAGWKRTAEDASSACRYLDVVQNKDQQHIIHYLF